MKIKLNLSKKLFIITLLLLIGLMGFTLAFEIFFFQFFYEKRKLTNLSDEVEKFKTMYSYQLSDDATRNDALAAFENKTNSKLIIRTSDGTYLTNRFSYSSNPPVGDPSDIDLYREMFENGDLTNKVVTTDKTISNIFYNQSSKTKKIGVISAISINTKNDSVIVAVASIQPIKEAASVISEFYIYIFLGFLLASILLSLIYSNFISKPLVKIDKIAKKMAKMDFEEKCDIKSNDEIGSLGQTLNFLSETLDSTLKSLKEKNEQLEHDIEVERKLEIMRKDFVDSVSHELKTPIGIIEGYAEGIKDGIVSDQDVLVYLETIIDESKKMGVLVTNMLELSKLEHGTEKLKLELFNINRLINKIVKKHSVDASSKKLSLTFNQNSEYSYVLADRFQMEQVITNLITNAIKYTRPNNNIIVSIDDNDKAYRIVVFNSGAHLIDAEIPKLFNRFYRQDKSGNRGTNSTGLGLSIVKHILDAHNSPFTFQNTNDGVAFIFYLEKQEITEEE